MVLAGMALGLLATLYGACRYAWRFARLASDLSDGLWFMAAALVLLAGLVVADWGQLRLWTLVLAGVGFGLWTLLAEPLLFYIASFMAAALARGAHRFCGQPVVWMARQGVAMLGRGWQRLSARWPKPRA